MSPVLYVRGKGQSLGNGFILTFRGKRGSPVFTVNGEIIIADNGNTDGSQQIIEEHKLYLTRGNIVCIAESQALIVADYRQFKWGLNQYAILIPEQAQKS